MADTIDFLERLGQDARLRHATDDEIRAALADAGIDPAVGEAVVTGDQRALATGLAARTNVCCLIWAPLRPQEEEEKDAPQDVPPQNHGPKSQQRRVA